MFCSPRLSFCGWPLPGLDSSQVDAAADQTDWIKRSLDAVATALLKRAFQMEQRPLLSPDGRPSNRVADVWLDSQGTPKVDGR